MEANNANFGRFWPALDLAVCDFHLGGNAAAGVMTGFPRAKALSGQETVFSAASSHYNENRRLPQVACER
jgi:hypothetical protein